MSRPGWEAYFLEMAALAARRSTCPRRAVGAVLVRDQRVVATGYNGSLRGQPHCSEAGCLMVDGHCKRTVHAEMNALLQCAFHGVPSRGSALFTTSFPCLDCAKALVQAGVTAVYYRDAYPDAHSGRVLEGAGVALRCLEPGGSEQAGREGALPVAVRDLGERRPVVAEAGFVADSAEVDGEVELGAGATVWYGAVLRGDGEAIRVGAESNIQDGCILHTDPGQPCVVGCRVTVGHGAVLHGCRVEDDVLIGMRATVLSGAVVGRGAVVGAGALVREGQVVPPGTVVVGVPARVARSVRPEEAERMRRGVEHYLELGRLHRQAAGAAR